MRRVVLVVFAVACGSSSDQHPVDASVDATVDVPAVDAPVYGGPMLSCSGLASTCGASGTSSCCNSPLVAGGTFYRSYDASGNAAPQGWAGMTAPATISSFRLDTYEITVGRFRQFVNAGAGTQASPPPAGAGARTLNGTPNQGGWDPAYNASLAASSDVLRGLITCNTSYTETAGANDSLPMPCITWYEAFAFCVWDGGFLPTEAEWNYAATAGTDQRAYPWSGPASSLTIDCTYANYASSTTTCGGAAKRVGSQSPKGDSKYGQADLAGNLWEWTLDWTSTYATPCNDCAALAAASTVRVRGGSFAPPFDPITGEASLRSAWRDFSVPGRRSAAIGIRCARHP